MRDINEPVTIKIPRWTTESVPLIELLIDRIVQISKWNDEEYDLYKKMNGHMLERIGSIKIEEADLDLFEAEPREFWEKYADQLDDGIIDQITTVRNPNWYVNPHV